jgi:broad specificity phosphatase PhoE
MDIEHSFYFLRHGQTQWNKDRITQGQLDSQLNATGRAQAERAAEILEKIPIARIVASPLSRARLTAETVAARHDVEIIFDDGLKECNLGDRQGEPHGDWLADYWSGKYHPPNGESFYQFCERVWAAMQRAILQGSDTLIVAHGGLWLAAHEYVSIQPEMRLLPNALPVHIKPAKGIWHHTVLNY